MSDELTKWLGSHQTSITDAVEATLKDQGYGDMLPVTVAFSVQNGRFHTDIIVQYRAGSKLIVAGSEIARPQNVLLHYIATQKLNQLYWSLVSDLAKQVPTSIGSSVGLLMAKGTAWIVLQDNRTGESFGWMLDSASGNLGQWTNYKAAMYRSANGQTISQSLDLESGVSLWFADGAPDPLTGQDQWASARRFLGID